MDRLHLEPHNWLLGSWRDGGEAETVCLLLCGENGKAADGYEKCGTGAICFWRSIHADVISRAPLSARQGQEAQQDFCLLYGGFIRGLGS